MSTRPFLVPVHLGLALFAAFSAVVACSGSSGDSPAAPNVIATPADASPMPPVSDASADDASDDAADAAPPTYDAAISCSAASKRSACVTCCQDQHPAGYKVFEAATLQCACAAGICADACATTACAATPKKPDATCQQCLEESTQKPLADAGTDADGGAARGACAQDVKDACSASSDCVALRTCEDACPK